ncbi:MAG: hypothetical protein IPJ32_10690 [Sphingobacteriaceae bacterium]|nr:hypothetical protein [Sphingobacteriaceae bacterium]
MNGNIYNNEKYLIAEDLLGADFWMDYDQFAENLGADPMFIQNNIDKPDNMIKKGDKFGYNYAIHINRGELWGQAEYNLKALDVYVGLSVSSSQTWRDGYWANGKFPTNSKGQSENLIF